jgi:hypothetical protein
MHLNTPWGSLYDDIHSLIKGPGVRVPIFVLHLLILEAGSELYIVKLPAMAVDSGVHVFPLYMPQ